MEITNETQITTELLNTANWRDDDTLSLKVRDENVPAIAAKPDQVQIFTNCNGKTMLMPAGENLEPVEIGKTVGTTVTENGISKDTWNADTKLNITDLINNLNETTGGKVLDARQGKALKALVDNLEFLKLNKNALLDLVYPVGSIYTSETETDPTGCLGGVWEKTDTPDYVIEYKTGLSGSGFTNGWYRKYKSGWLEQGGLTKFDLTKPNNTIFFSKKFLRVNSGEEKADYSITLALIKNAHTSNVFNTPIVVLRNDNAMIINCSELVAISPNAVAGGWYNESATWEARGMAAGTPTKSYSWKRKS
jgi:hypothetical protein